MGRRGATYEARLDVMVNLCYRLTFEKGFIRPENLAEEMNLSPRMIRDYLNDLLALDILRYKGHNDYSFNFQLFTDTGLSDSEKIIPDSLLKRILNIRTEEALIEPSQIQQKVERIYKKMEHIFKFPDGLRNDIINTDLSVVDSKLLRSLNAKKVIGDSLIEYKPLKETFFDQVIVSGSAAVSRMQTTNVKDLMLMTLSFLASSTTAIVYHKNRIKNDKSRIITRPDVEQFTANEPFERIDPFYDMYHDFPELLIAGRSIATRYLTEKLHMSTIADFLTDGWLDKMEDYQLPFIFRKGLLVPHGFIVRGKILADLQKRAFNTIAKTINLSNKKGIYIVGITTTPKDDLYFKMIKTIMGTETLGRMNDLNFFRQILKNHDVTCLIEKRSEKGRQDLNVPIYEFYTKELNNVLKIEFYTYKKDPLVVRDEILHYLRATITPPPKPYLPYSPSVTTQANMESLIRLNYLNKIINQSLELSFDRILDSTADLHMLDLDNKYLQGLD